MTHALIVTDMINDFCHKEGKLYSPNIAEIIPEVAAHIESARVQQQPILYLVDTHREDDPEFKMFPKHATSAWGREPVAGIRAAWSPLGGRERLIPKSTFSGFFRTDLDAMLKSLDVTEITIVGNCTDICVLFTAADARARGYEVTIPSSAVATFRDTDWQVYALAILKEDLGCKVLPAHVPAAIGV